MSQQLPALAAFSLGKVWSLLGQTNHLHAELLASAAECGDRSRGVLDHGAGAQATPALPDAVLLQDFFQPVLRLGIYRLRSVHPEVDHVVVVLVLVRLTSMPESLRHEVAHRR